MRIKDLQTIVHGLAKEKGWYEGAPRNPLELHMLIVSEIAEATECARRDEGPLTLSPTGKPEGELVELADAVIRILDYCEFRGWDLEGAIALKHKYNKSRPHRHGGKKY